MATRRAGAIRSLAITTPPVLRAQKMASLSRRNDAKYVKNNEPAKMPNTYL